MLKPALITAPADTPVSVAECKAHLRVTDSGEDALIGTYLQAAVSRLDGWAGLLGRCIFTQTWRADYEGWPFERFLRLPFCDVQAVTSLKYSDEDDVEQTVDNAYYRLVQDEIGSMLWLNRDFTKPSVYDDRPDPVRVQFTAGFGTATACPAAIKAAILLLVGDFYENREDTVIGPGIDMRPLPTGVASLIAPYRRVGV